MVKSVHFGTWLLSVVRASHMTDIEKSFMIRVFWWYLVILKCICLNKVHKKVYLGALKKNILMPMCYVVSYTQNIGPDE